MSLLCYCLPQEENSGVLYWSFMNLHTFELKCFFQRMILCLIWLILESVFQFQIDIITEYIRNVTWSITSDSLKLMGLENMTHVGEFSMPAPWVSGVPHLQHEDRQNNYFLTKKKLLSFQMYHLKRSIPYCSLFVQ